MEQLVSTVLTVMNESLTNNDWLPPDTKEKEIQKSIFASINAIAASMQTTG